MPFAETASRLFKILATTLVCLLASALAATSAQASGASAFPASEFLDDAGTPVSMTNLLRKPEERAGFLVFFWANWCVPCKEELSMAAARPDLLSRYVVIALNVDDDADWPQARAALAAKQWPFLSWRDPAGRVFYSIRPTGDLPWLLHFDSDGKLVGTHTAIQPSTLEEFARAGTDTGKSAAGGTFSFAGEHHFRKTLANEDTDAASLFAQSLSAAYERESFGLRLTHDLLRQDRTGEIWEDELGQSHVEWRKTLSAAWGPESFRIRAGDDSVRMQSGLTLSIERNEDTARFLRGGHLNLGWSRVKLEARAGAVRNRLFDVTLDPTTDVSVAHPDTRVAAVGLSIYGPWNLSATAAHFENGDNVSDRFGAGVQTQAGNLEMRLDGALYDVGHALHSELAWSSEPWELSPAWNLQLSIPTTYVRSVRIPDFVAVPVLSLDLATPLSATRQHSLRLAPQATLKASWGEVSFGPAYVREEGLGEERGDLSETFAFQQVAPDFGEKLFISRRTYETKALGETGTEFAASAGSNLVVKYLTGQYTWRRLTTEEIYWDGERAAQETRRGVRRSANLGLHSGEALGRFGRVGISVTETRQSGPYVGLSGIDREKLRSWRVFWSQSVFEIRAAFGTEPGGVVCSAGSCRQLPPLHGTALDATLAAEF